MGYFVIPTAFILIGIVFLFNTCKFSIYLSKAYVYGRNPLKSGFLFMRLIGFITGGIFIFFGIQSFLKAFEGH